MIDLNANISKITTIPKATLDELTNKVSLCIAQAAYNLTEEPVTIDLGIGSLTIAKQPEGIRYKFIPSSLLQQQVYQAS